MKKLLYILLFVVILTVPFFLRGATFVLFGGSDDGTAVSVATGASDNNIAVTKGYVDDAIPVKATGAELTTGTDDAKFATAKSIKDSHNVPSVVPSTDGNVMTSNGTDWVSEAPAGGGGGGGAFSTTSNVTSNTTGTLATDDFVFGSDQLADDGNTDHDKRMWFDKSKGAFRAGYVIGTQWDDVNVGSYSTAFGYSSTASGSYSTAFGYSPAASGSSSTAFGYSPTASGDYSTAFGHSPAASGSYSTAFGGYSKASGSSSTAFGYSSTASGSYSTAFGYSSTASGSFSTAFGYHSVSYLMGQVSHSMGKFSTAGDSQNSSIILRADTPSNVEEIMYIDNAIAYKPIIPADTVWNFTGKINAINSGGVGIMSGKIEGVLKRATNTTTLLVCTTSELIDELTVVFKVVPDDTDDYLKILVTGKLDEILHWNCSIDMLETGF